MSIFKDIYSIFVITKLIDIQIPNTDHKLEWIITVTMKSKSINPIFNTNDTLLVKLQNPQI